MNKYILGVMVASAIMAGCTGNSNSAKKAVDPHAGHNHAKIEETDPHAGHNHATEGHDHQAEAADPHAGHNHAKAEAAPKEAATEDGSHADEIIFPVAQAKRTDFEVSEVVARSFSEVIKTSGQILAAQGDEASVTAPVSGVVSFAGTKLAEGAAVGKGQKIFNISSKNIATGDAATQSAATYRKTKADFERAQSLLADKIVSKKEFDAIKMEYEQAKNQYEALAGAQSAKGTGVSSTIGGYVTELLIKEGDFVEMGQPLATVSQNRRLVLRAEVSQKYYNKLKNIKSANFVTPYSDQFFSLSEMNGHLLSVGKASPTGSYLVPVTFEFDNKGGVVAGSFVEIYLTGTPIDNAVTLPITAITEQQGITYIYAQLDEEGYQRREVVLGASDGERVLIEQGVEIGDRVVTRGAVNVKMASASGSIPHGHAH